MIDAQVLTFALVAGVLTDAERSHHRMTTWRELMAINHDPLVHPIDDVHVEADVLLKAPANEREPD